MRFVTARYYEQLVVISKADSKSTLGEGAIWNPDTQRLLWVNIPEGEVNEFDPETKSNKTIKIPNQSVGTVVPRLNKPRSVAIVTTKAFAFLDLDTETLQVVKELETDLPENRFNDGKVDPAGRFWAGTMDTTEKEPKGSLYCLFEDHSVKKMDDKTTVSNGICWSADNKTMYYIDSPTQRVFAYDYDLATSAVSNKRTVFQTAGVIEGFPDGMTIDTEGVLWIAMWGGSSVVRVDPHQGKLLTRVPLPVSQVTSCWFGGKDLDRLFVTTAKRGLDTSKEPLAGSMFEIIGHGAKGLPTVPYKG